MTFQNHAVEGIIGGMNKIFTSFSIIIISTFIITSIVSAATTISTDISTGGSMTVVGTSTLATTTFSGNVGVGTTSPYAKLSVSSELNAGDSPYLFVVASSTYSSTDSTTLFTVSNSGGVTARTTSSTGTGLAVFSSGPPVSLYRYTDTLTNGATILLRRAGGTIDSPTMTLSGSLLGGMQVRGFVESTGAFQTGNSGEFGFYAAQDFATPGSRGTYFSISTAGIGGTLGERIRIDSTGNVGIGTTTPTTQLQVTSSATNATTTLTVGKVGQNKGTCHEEFRSDGAVIYWWWTPAGAMATSSSSCK